VTGHGEAWVDIATALERAAKTQFGLRLNLRCLISYARELRHSGTSCSYHICGWGFSSREVNELIERWRQQEP
jgi:hypothetical protein